MTHYADADHTVPLMPSQPVEIPQDLYLRPTRPTANMRYSSITMRYLPPVAQTVIPAFTRLCNDDDTLTLPPGWRKYIHCEGDTYFHHQNLHVVTPVDPRDSEALAWLLIAHQRLTERGAESDRRDILDKAEIYLDLTGNGVVNYCIIDHEALSVFWAEDVNVGELNVPAFETLSHLKSALASEYWVHIDYYPMHQPPNRTAENILLGMLRQCSVDDMTAPGSTSPYSAKECQQLLKVLEGFRDDIFEARGYRAASFARISGAFARVHDINQHGLPYPRLDRLQSLSAFTATQLHHPSRLLNLAEMLLFVGQSRGLSTRMTALWNGRVVYERHWTAFFKDMRRDWVRMGGFSLGVWLATIILIASKVTTLTVIASSSFAPMSLLIALVLIGTHSHDRLATAPDISAYVAATESYHHGLRPLSLVFSLPQALTIYAALLLQIGLLMEAL